MIRAYFENFAGEAVSVSRQGFDPIDTLSSQRLSQRRDLKRQVRVFDERIGPKRGHEFFLRENSSAAFHQQEEKVEGFRRQRDMFAVSAEKTFGRI